ncbi:MAG: hypothetical protein CO108_08235 [Deltaproteobacteria bacterium CG_4_9_14_3_um_filter_63_12]|nr:MAG: hypothetical protein CO108_08235 [Deltaproteobacteria bacterium CG_4_9_14_3_um_filter_63_12]
MPARPLSQISPVGPHQRWASRTCCAVGAALLSFLLVLGAAQAGDLLPGTVAEKEALATLEAGKNIRAREQAEAILEDEDSFIATFVRAEVYFTEEANLARALFLMRKAEDMLLDAYSTPPEDREAVRWHKKVLMEEVWILAEMDDREGQLAVLERYDSYYQPSIEEYRIWPLVKLERYDEAQEIGERLIYSDDFQVRLKAYNGLMALGDEKRDRKMTLKWGVEGIEKTQEKSCVIAANVGLSAMQNLLFDDAERYIKIAKKAELQDCSLNPLAQAAQLYLLQGEFQKTISTFEQLRKEPFDPRMRAQFEMHNKSRFVELLYALGQFEAAEERAFAVMSAPDRAGMTSASEENRELVNVVLYWLTLQARQVQERERAAVRPFFDSVGIWNKAGLRSLDQWEKKRMAIRLATQQKLMVTIIRPYFTDIAPWYLGAVIDLLGPGVVKKAVAEARDADADVETKLGEELGGYFDALDGEASWKGGDADEAIRLGRSALERLPKQTLLLRWRVQAWLSAILWERGEQEEALEMMHEVMVKYPTAFRILDLEVPVRLEGGGSDDAEQLMRLLLSSPRLRIEDGGFTVNVNGHDDKVSTCLLSAKGFNYGCSEWSREAIDKAAADDDEDELDDDERWARGADAFHDTVFAPKVELTQADINTLDGRPSRVGAEEAVDKLLEGVGP